MKKYVSRNRVVLAIIILMVAFATISCGEETSNDSSSEKDEEISEDITKLSGKKLLEYMDFEDKGKVKYTSVTKYAEGGSDEMSITMHVIMDGDNMRMESNTPGMEMTTITNSDDGIIYTWMDGSETGSASKIYNEDDMDMDMETEESPDDMIGSIDENMDLEIVDYEGQQALHVKYDESEDNMETEMWISVKYKMPIKFVSMKDGETIVSMTTSDMTDKGISNSDFEPPSNVKFNDVD